MDLSHLSAADAASRLAALLDSAMDAILSVDETGRVVMYNRAAEQTFGWKAADIMGQPLERLIPARFRAGHAGHIRHFAATGVTSRRKGEGVVLYGLRADGTEFPMDASISQVDTGHGKLSAHLDLREPKDLETLRGLVRERRIGDLGPVRAALVRRLGRRPSPRARRSRAAGAGDLPARAAR